MTLCKIIAGEGYEAESRIVRRSRAQWQVQIVLTHPYLRRSVVASIPSASLLAKDGRLANQGHVQQESCVLLGQPDAKHGEDVLGVVLGGGAGERGPHACMDAADCLARLCQRRLVLGGGLSVLHPLCLYHSSPRCFERGEGRSLLGLQLGRGRRAHQGCRWLHLACHALVDPERPWASRIVLGGRLPEHQQLRAAGVLRRRFPAALVVLSCCDTGLGRIVPGEGVLGLPRAFLAAGAQAVCATLWPILDHAGPPLMRAMYGQLREGAPPWQALRAAQLRQIERGAPTSTWAGYTIIG